ncbi:MAG TPA: low temperature requirement protein A [Miltoncostaeaceae bacterium]|nr:low temperature requirement protein A [Miltoncostaeaceae bacterium]
MPTIVLRAREGAAPRVTSMELFFDLVYVFAVTQLSQKLLGHLTARGAIETLVLFGAVWWAWNYTAWATNWIDPDRLPVRVLLAVLMLLSLVMSASIPEAFADRALPFALAYVAIQLLRSGFMVVAFRGRVMGRNFAQLLAWSAIAGVVWIAGAGVEGDARLAVWIAALAIDLAAPMHGFWLPRLGSTPMADWTLAGGHLAERCQLVVIIALGESILVTGQVFSDLAVGAAEAAAFFVAFLGSLMLWWVYFARDAEEGVRVIAGAARESTRFGRTGYTYAHAAMVAGIIVTAVADELVIAHPSGGVSAAAAWVTLGGPAIYLAGNALFNRTILGRPPVSRLVAIAALALLAAVAPAVSPLGLSAAATAVLVALAVSDVLVRRVPRGPGALVADPAATMRGTGGAER